MGDGTAVGGRSGYWFPLVLLGFGLLGLLGWDSLSRDPGYGWFAFAPQQYANTQDLFGTTFYSVSHGFVDSTSVAVKFETARFPMRDFSWSVLIIGTLVVTAAWYAWRARRAGGSVGGYVALAAGGGIAVLAVYVAVGMASAMPDPAEMVTSVGLPLVVLGALAGAWAYSRTRPWWRGAATVSVICLVIGVGTVLGAWAPGLLDAVLIAGGLLALARFERSRLLTVAALVALVAMVAFPVGTLSMLIPAVVVLAAAIVALVRQGTPA